MSLTLQVTSWVQCVFEMPPSPSSVCRVSTITVSVAISTLRYRARCRIYSHTHSHSWLVPLAINTRVGPCLSSLLAPTHSPTTHHTTGAVAGRFRELFLADTPDAIRDRAISEVKVSMDHETRACLNCTWLDLVVCVCVCVCCACHLCICTYYFL